MKWIHLRRLVPIGDLIAGLEKGGLSMGSAPRGSGGAPSAAAAAPGVDDLRRRDRRLARGRRRRRRRRASGVRASSRARHAQRPTPAGRARQRRRSRPTTGPLPADFKNRFLAEVQRANKTFYGFHLAQAQKIELVDDRLVFTFGPIHEVMRQQVEGKRGWLESIAESIAGRKVSSRRRRDRPWIRTRRVRPPRRRRRRRPGCAARRRTDLKARALADSGVQAMLEIFPADIRDVEEIK